MSCESRHAYCLPCIQNFMDEFFRRHSAPVCHSTFCNYELSPHDIAFLPLTRRVSDRLLPLARGQQRPQCPQCHLYIDVNETEEFYNHTDVCDGDLISCQYCFHPYAIDQLDAHTQRCENDKSSSNDKLINFVTKRTKYSFTKEQITLFVRQKQAHTFSKIDPLEIINALTEFGTRIFISSKVSIVGFFLFPRTDLSLRFTNERMRCLHGSTILRRYLRVRLSGES